MAAAISILDILLENSTYRTNVNDQVISSQAMDA